MKNILKKYADEFRGEYIKASLDIAQGQFDETNEIHQEAMALINGITTNEEKTLYRLDPVVPFDDIKVGDTLDKRFYSFSKNPEWISRVIRGRERIYVKLPNYSTAYTLIDSEYMDVESEYSEEVLTYASYRVVGKEVTEIIAEEIYFNDRYEKLSDNLSRFKKRMSKRGNLVLEDKRTGISYLAKDIDKLYISKQTGKVETELNAVNSVRAENEANALDNYTKNIVYIERIKE